jgi:hypothetical protein
MKTKYEYEAINGKRWVLVNKNTLKSGHGYATRAAARVRKTSSQFIYDTRNLIAVR